MPLPGLRFLDGRPLPGKRQGAALLPGALLMAVVWIFLTPEDAWAWGAGTHVALGEAVLDSLYLLPPAVRFLLERFSTHFLYGSVSADISFAKKYAPEGRHCHDWAIGEKILSTADSDRLRATAYGYLAHLAADTIAHNFFIPRQLLLTSATQALGHTYWEHRMDIHLGEEYLGKARRLVMEIDHSEADEHFDLVLSRTLFSFLTNRRIFRGMIRFQDNERWRMVFDQVLRRSRFDLHPNVVDLYFALAFDHVVGYLTNRFRSRAAALDPTGQINMRLAKKVRRRGMAGGGAVDPMVLQEMADEFFPLPESPLLYWPKREAVRRRRRSVAEHSRAENPG